MWNLNRLCNVPILHTQATRISMSSTQSCVKCHDHVINSSLNLMTCSENTTFIIKIPPPPKQKKQSTSLWPWNWSQSHQTDGNWWETAELIIMQIWKDPYEKAPKKTILLGFSPHAGNDHLPWRCKRRKQVHDLHNTFERSLTVLYLMLCSCNFMLQE